LFIVLLYFIISLVIVMITVY